MRVEEIALRQEMRELLREAGLDKKEIRKIAEDVLREEIAKQVKSVFSQTNVTSIVNSRLSSCEGREMIRKNVSDAVSDMVQKQISISVSVKECGSSPDGRKGTV